MARLYIAYQNDAEEPLRLASGSLTIMKKRLREYPETSWTLAEYLFKPSVSNLCQLIEDISEVEAETAQTYRITASGQVRASEEP